MTTIQTSLLDLRNNLGKYLLELNKNPITITKRGKKVAILIGSKDAQDFLQWKEDQELKELYYQSKVKFQKYGDNFLQTKNLKQIDLTIDQLIETVSNA